MAVCSGPDAYLECVESVEHDAYDILTEDQYFVTEEFSQELYHILSRLEQMRLDHDLLSSCKNLQKSHSASSPHAFNKRYEVLPVLKAASDFLREYKKKMRTERLKVREVNQVREFEEWAMLNINNLEKMLNPYLVDAYNRIRTFSDNIGVTDRFTGFRNNLTRGSDKPFIYEPSWLRDSAVETAPRAPNSVLFGHHPETLRNQLMLPPVSHEVKILSSKGVPAFRPHDLASRVEDGACAYGGPIEKLNALVEKKTGILGTNLRIGGVLPPERINRGYLTIDSLYPGNTIEYDLHHPCNSLLMRIATDKSRDKQPTPEPYNWKNPQDLESIQKGAGLDAHPDFSTEYKAHYVKPDRNFPGVNFVVNPCPHLNLFGRDYLPLEAVEYSTEYQSRFNWPDKNNLYKLPWIKS